MRTSITCRRSRGRRSAPALHGGITSGEEMGAPGATDERGSMIDLRSHMAGALLITTATAALVLAATPVRADSLPNRLPALGRESPRLPGGGRFEVAPDAPQRPYTTQRGRPSWRARA